MADAPAMALFWLHKKFGTKTAVDHVDLVVPRGSFFGLVGPNGAGKTTSRSMAVDGSGLTKAAYAAAGVQPPRTAKTQFDVGPRVSVGQPVIPGDLVFFGGGPNALTHVGIAISSTEMINAPDEGAVVRIDSIPRSNYVGATRPASFRGGCLSNATLTSSAPRKACPRR